MSGTFCPLGNSSPLDNCNRRFSAYCAIIVTGTITGNHRDDSPSDHGDVIKGTVLPITCTECYGEIMKKLVLMVAGAIIAGVILLMSVISPDLEDQSVSPIKITGTAGIQPGGTIRAKVKKIVDGDTLWVVYEEEEYKVRLLCIDTPETVKVNVDEQPYGKIATEKFTEMVMDKEVTLVFEKDIKDNYDRLLAYVILNSGTCVNTYMVENGLARVEMVRPNTVQKDYFNKLQDNAIKEKRGLWSLPVDERPFIINDKGYYVPRYIDNDAA